MGWKPPWASDINCSFRKDYKKKLKNAIANRIEYTEIA